MFRDKIGGHAAVSSLSTLNTEVGHMMFAGRGLTSDGGSGGSMPDRRCDTGTRFWWRSGGFSARWSPGDFPQATVIMYDPTLLSEACIPPTTMWVHDPALRMNPYPCEEATESAMPFGSVSDFLPGQSTPPGLILSPRIGSARRIEASGLETTYRKYIAKMKAMPRPTLTAPPGSDEP